MVVIRAAGWATHAAALEVSELDTEAFLAFGAVQDLYWEDRWEKQARDFGTPGTRLQYTYYREIKKSLEARNESIEGLGEDPEAWRQRQREVREVLRTRVLRSLDVEERRCQSNGRTVEQNDAVDQHLCFAQPNSSSVLSSLAITLFSPSFNTVLTMLM